MARNIVDTANRTVSVPARKSSLKWLVIGLLLVCIIGVIAGGYFAFINKPIPAAIQKPPVQSNPVSANPTPTQSTTPTPNPIPVLEVKWKSNGPLDAQLIDVISFDDDKGKIIYAVGYSEGERTPGSIWKSNNGGGSWEYVGKITNPEINFREKEKIYKESVLYPSSAGLYTGWTADGKPLVFEFRGQGDNPTGEKRDPNNEEIILKPNLIGRTIATPLTHPYIFATNDPNASTEINIWEFLLSFDNGKTFFRIDLPPPYNNGVGLFVKEYTLISSNGILKIFYSRTKVWQAEINLP